ncbi:unnamed protein product [Parajaminaea phylloscopi]
MACPVNHPMFHAVVFLIGVLVVLSRYVRAATPASELVQSQMMSLVAAGVREGFALSSASPLVALLESS